MCDIEKKFRYYKNILYNRFFFYKYIDDHENALIKHKYSVYLINIKISFMSEFGDLAAFQHV